MKKSVRDNISLLLKYLYEFRGFNLYYSQKDITKRMNVSNTTTKKMISHTDNRLLEPKTDQVTAMTPMICSDSSRRESVSTRLITKLRVTPCGGILLALLSGVFMASAGFIVKLIPNVNPIEIVITRSLVQLIVFYPVILYRRLDPLGVREERTSVLFRSLFGFISFSLCYTSYRMIPLGDASTIVFSAPVYVSLFACLFLNEECGLFQILTITMTITGVLLISKPTFLFGYDQESVGEITMRMEGTILAFISSLFAAGTFIMMRKLQKTPTAVVIFWFSIISVLMGSLILIIICNLFKEEAGMLSEGIGIPESYQEILWLVANGLFSVLGQLCVTVSLKIEEAGLVSLARTIDIVMAFLFQVAFLKKEVVHWTSIVGAVIVCSGVCISALRRWLRGKPGEYNTLWLILNCGVKRKVAYPGDRVNESPHSFATSSGSSSLHTPEIIDVHKIKLDHNFEEEKEGQNV